MQSAGKAGCIIFQLDISKGRRQSHQVRLPAQLVKKALTGLF